MHKFLQKHRRSFCSNPRKQELNSIKENSHLNFGLNCILEFSKQSGNRSGVNVRKGPVVTGKNTDFQIYFEENI